MKIRSTQSLNAIPATIIWSAFNLQLSNLLCKLHCKNILFISLTISKFSICEKFFTYRPIFTYLFKDDETDCMLC